MSRLTIAALAALVTLLSSLPASAELPVVRTARNSIEITKMCRTDNVDPRACMLLAKPVGIPLVSPIRYMAQRLANVIDEGRADNKLKAMELMPKLQDAVGSSRSAHKSFNQAGISIGSSNAGFIIERAWLNRLTDCKTNRDDGIRKPCVMLDATGKQTFNEALALLGEVYKEDKVIWDYIAYVINAERL